MIQSDERKTFTSSKGEVIKLRPVSQYKIDTLRSSKKELPIPQYEMDIAGGGKQSVNMDEKIAFNQGRTAEWLAYVQQKSEIEKAYAQKFLELVVWEGVEVDVPDQESEWQKQSDYFGIVIPTNPIPRKLFYVHNELLATADDIGNLIAEIFAVSQIDEGAVQQLRDSFRSFSQRNGSSEPTANEKPLESEPNFQHSGSDPLLESAAE